MCYQGLKVVFKCHNSEDLYEVSDQIGCYQTSYSLACENDPTFYQICGHTPCSEYQKVAPSTTFSCGSWLCEEKTSKISYSGRSRLSNYRCNDQDECANTDFDESYCVSNLEFQCKHTGSSYSINEKCDLKCDCFHCDDEAFCNGFSYGYSCHFDTSYRSSPNMCKYLPSSGCRKECEKEPIITYCKPGTAYYLKYPKDIRPVYRTQICSVPAVLQEDVTCRDGLDQVNCADPKRIALQCTMDGALITVSLFALCKGYQLCDDDYQNLCVEVEDGCTLHRNLLCDGNQDCASGQDEKLDICDVSKNSSLSCTRRVSLNSKNYSNHLPIPLDWVVDGHVDCIDHQDEILQYWQQCGNGATARYVEKDSQCEDMFVCPAASDYVAFLFLCDIKEDCPGEQSVCSSSRGQIMTEDKLYQFSDMKTVGYCLPGLGHYELFKNLPCIHENPSFTDYQAFGVSQQEVIIPIKNASPNIQLKMFCKYSYGELYVYLVCSGLCPVNEVIPCPLRHSNQDDCLNIKEKVLTITSMNTLTTAYPKNNSYYNDIFACSNKRCITYDKVCNLADDCGDKSDESNCHNHFMCENKEIVPLTSKCDGKIDCSDYSDECSMDCPRGNHNLFANDVYLIISILFGSLAILFNGVVVIKTSQDLKKSSVLMGRMNKLMILLISIGDFFMGTYLLVISCFHIYYSNKYCLMKYKWLSSLTCAIIGIINTVSSQTSLFAMTGLSIIRVTSFTTMIPQDGTSLKSKVKLLFLTVLVMGPSILIAVLPLMNSFEDFFVNGLFYNDVPLFTGIVDKKKHYAIFEKYYSRFKSPSLTWINIRKLVHRMFTTDYSGIRGKRVHFYGNDAVCIFKYLVRKSDPQLLFSCSILFLNFACFIFISLCYIIIQYKAHVSERRTTLKKPNNNGDSKRSQQQLSQRRNVALQRKVTLIILTDFLCWVPFTITCILHLSEVFDATSSYPLFSSLILPINSVINPLLYDSIFFDTAVRICKSILNFTVHVCHKIGVCTSVSEIYVAQNNSTLSVQVTTM